MIHFVFAIRTPRPHSSPRDDLIPSRAQRVPFNRGAFFFYVSPSLSLTNVGRSLLVTRETTNFKREC